MARDTVTSVAKKSLDYADEVVVVDDACPEGSGSVAERLDKRITVIFRDQNGGVGAASKTGFSAAVKKGADIIVKLDADGQMEPHLIPQLIAPLVSGASDLSKGTRFDSPEDLEGMPTVRLVGNSFLSLINKFSSGYWSINDPTNGFVAFTRMFHERLSWAKISDGYFFESDILFRSRLIGARITQMRMKSVYSGQRSGLRPLKVAIPFAWRHLINQTKRVAYMYFVREWNLGTLYVLAGSVSLGVGIGASVRGLAQAEMGEVGTGTAVLASLGYILWVQFYTAFLTVDVTSEPK